MKRISITQFIGVFVLLAIIFSFTPKLYTEVSLSDGDGGRGGGGGGVIVIPPSEIERVKADLRLIRDAQNLYYQQNEEYLISDNNPDEIYSAFGLQIAEPNWEFSTRNVPDLAFAKCLNPPYTVFSIGSLGEPEIIAFEGMGDNDGQSRVLEMIESNTTWPVSTGGPVTSSVAIANLDPSDAQLELIVGSNDAKIYAWNDDASSMISNQTSGFFAATNGAVISSPAIADLNNDGSLEVIAGSDDDIWVWNNAGQEVFNISFSWPNLIRSTPAVANLDGDSFLEIIIGTNKASPNNIYFIDNNGTYNVFASALGSCPFSSPAIGDLDNDGVLEVVIGSEDSYGHIYDWKVLANHTGQQIYSVNTGPNQWVRSSPALADIDGDGNLETIVGTTPNSGSGKLFVLKPDGTNAIGWPKDLDGPIRSSPAVGDIIGVGDSAYDKDLEIVAATKTGTIYAFYYNGTTVSGLWPVVTGQVIDSSPSIADIDGDNEMEIILGTGSGNLMAFHNDGSQVTGWPRTIGPVSLSSPALEDLNLDGNIEVIIGSTDNKVYNPGPLGSYNADSIQWGKFRRTLTNTGYYGRPDRQRPYFNPLPVPAHTIVSGQPLSFSVSAHDNNLITDLRYKPIIGDALFLNTPNQNHVTGDFSWTPQTPGEYPLQFVATDEYGLHSIETPVMINVTDRAPILDLIGNRSGQEGTLLTFPVRASDLDLGDAVSVTVTSNPLNSYIGNDTNPDPRIFEASFNWLPDYNESGTYNNIIFTARDSYNVTDSEPISITIDDFNRLPNLDPIGDKYGQEGELLYFWVMADDPDGDPVTITVGSNPGTLNQTVYDPVLLKYKAYYYWEPNYNQAGDHTVTFEAVDEHSVTENREPTRGYEGRDKILD